MELPEIELLVGEAENRVERLRSLYDQYFMGIERIEPQTARKDVERRIQILRKTQIRNTALRFRFQNVLLRYNTFSAHWLRICRQIEEGTYKHHLRKAKERFDPNEAAREAHAARKAAAKLEYGDTEPPGPPTFEMDEDLDVDIDFDEHGGSSRPPGGRSPHVESPDVRAALRSYAIPQDAVAPSVAGRALASMTGPGQDRPAEAKKGPPQRDASLDRATDPAPPPSPSMAPVKPGPPPLARPGTPAMASRPGAVPVPGRPPPPPPGAAGGGKPTAPPVPGRPAAPAAAPQPGAAAPDVSRPPQPPPLARPGTAPMIRPVGAPPGVAAASAKPPPPGAPPGAAASRPPPQATPLARPDTVPMIRPTGAQPTAASGASRPVAPAASRPVAQARPAAAAPAAGNQHDPKTRELYSKFVETRRSLGESTASVTMDGIAKSIRESGEKLRQKHPGKNIEFDVQVKDGKAVLKPIVR